MAIGDFRQCLPVVEQGGHAQIVASTVAYAPFWNDVKVMQLRVNMRVLAQAAYMSVDKFALATQFAAWQLEVGDGSANHDGISIKLPSVRTPYLLDAHTHKYIDKTLEPYKHVARCYIDNVAIF
jgi:hypothetical protein